jgi:hypothetical protein
MPDRLRVIRLDGVQEYLEQVAELAVSDDELRARGVPMVERDSEDGLGEYTGSAVELATGNQFVLRRLQLHPDGLGIFARLTADAREQTARLLAALRLSPECVTWQVPLDAWHQLQDRARDYDSRR